MERDLLKSCPFCGGKVVMAHQWTLKRYFLCVDCEAEIHFRKVDRMCEYEYANSGNTNMGNEIDRRYAEAWNRRAS